LFGRFNEESFVTDSDVVTEMHDKNSPGSPRPAGLRAGALGAIAVGVMAVAFEAPSVSVFFNSPFAAASAKSGLPAAFVLASIAIALVGWNIVSFARKLPTSGYAYTFVSNGLGSRMGFIAGWMTLMAFAATPLIVPPAFGVTFSDLVNRLTGVRIPWVILSLALLVGVGTLVIIGIRQSLRVGAAFLAFEVTVLTGFAVYMVINGGPQGNDPSTLLPSAAPSFGSLGLALVFGILSFQGFESAATLGEETREAKKRVPLAVMSAVAATGVFYTFVAYASTIGWGPSKMAGFASSGTPLTTLALHYGGTWLADLLDGVVSAGLVAVTIAATNGAARVLYALGRERLLPPALGVISPRTQTPWVASLAILVLFGGGGTILAAAWDPLKAWGFFGTVQALSAIAVYMFVSVACIRFFWTRHRDEFSFLSHLLVPVVAIGVLLLPLVLKGGLIWPAPSYPFNLPPYITLIWLVVAVAIMAFLIKRRPEALERAGRAFTD
jgi:amino acid transporter